jgi:hypothetical protein
MAQNSNSSVIVSSSVRGALLVLAVVIIVVAVMILVAIVATTVYCTSVHMCLLPLTREYTLQQASLTSTQKYTYGTGHNNQLSKTLQVLVVTTSVSVNYIYNVNNMNKTRTHSIPQMCQAGAQERAAVVAS